MIKENVSVIEDKVASGCGNQKQKTPTTQRNLVKPIM